MTAWIEWCDCRWCADEHPGGMLLFVTLPSNKFARMVDQQAAIENKVSILDALYDAEYQLVDLDALAQDDEGDGQLALLEITHAKPPRPKPVFKEDITGSNLSRHTFGRLLIPPGGFDGQDIEDILEWRIPWACDNGSFNVFDEPRFRKMMDHLANRPMCHFVAAPDVVWNKFAGPDPRSPDPVVRRYGERHLAAIHTIEKFISPELGADGVPWYQFIRDRGLPAAMVAQDGLELYDAEIPWDLMDAYFVGGSDAWKTSAESEHYIKEARRRGMWVHVGRVSSNERVGWCMAAGASSFDGSAFGRFRDSLSSGRDGMGRLQAGLHNAGSNGLGRLFVSTREGDHDIMSPDEEKESSDAQ